MTTTNEEPLIYTAADVAGMLAEERAKVIRYLRVGSFRWERKDPADEIEAGVHLRAGTPSSTKGPTVEAAGERCDRPIVGERCGGK